MARRKKKNSKKYYYVFVAVVLIIVLTVTFLDYKFRFGIVNWSEILQEDTSEVDSNDKESESESKIVSSADEIGNLRITFIDVGQGDAILINFPDGKNMLVDAGESYSKEELDKYLTVDGEKLRLDYVVATHSDSDHIGGMSYVYQNYEVGYSYRPYEKYSGPTVFPEDFPNEGFISKSSETYSNYLTAILDEGTPYSYFTDLSDFTVSVETKGEQIDYSVNFIMPYAKTVDGYKDFTDHNDLSAVIMLEFAGKKVILAGDMEADAEEKFVQYYEQNPSEIGMLDCDVLKVAHHGSATSSTLGFLNLIKAESFVISTGVCHGTYMHPRKTALDNISQFCQSLYRTDLQGTVTLIITPEGNMTYTTQTHAYDKYLYYDAYELLVYKDEIKSFKETL